MSALGQKRTCAVQKGMSALPPNATSIAFIRMSTMGQKRTWHWWISKVQMTHYPPTQIVECIQGRTNLLTDFGLWIDVLKSVNQRGIFGTQFFSQFVHSLKQRIELLGIPRLVSLLDLMTEPGRLAINSDLRFVSADDFENLLRVSLGHIRRGQGFEPAQMAR